MRKRWRCANTFPFVLIYGVGGFFVGMIATAIYGSCGQYGCGMNGDDAMPLFIAWAVWYGPAIVVAAVRIVRGLWSIRPRRVWESSPDIREVYRVPDQGKRGR